MRRIPRRPPRDRPPGTRHRIRGVVLRIGRSASAARTSGDAGAARCGRRTEASSALLRGDHRSELELDLAAAAPRSMRASADRDADVDALQRGTASCTRPPRSRASSEGEGGGIGSEVLGSGTDRLGRIAWEDRMRIHLVTDYRHVKFVIAIYVAVGSDRCPSTTTVGLTRAAALTRSIRAKPWAGSRWTRPTCITLVSPSDPDVTRGSNIVSNLVAHPGRIGLNCRSRGL
jgi:hypothetical protein